MTKKRPLPHLLLCSLLGCSAGVEPSPETDPDAGPRGDSEIAQADASPADSDDVCRSEACQPDARLAIGLGDVAGSLGEGVRPWSYADFHFATSGGPYREIRMPITITSEAVTDASMSYEYYLQLESLGEIRLAIHHSANQKLLQARFRDAEAAETGESDCSSNGVYHTCTEFFDWVAGQESAFVVSLAGPDEWRIDFEAGDDRIFLATAHFTAGAGDIVGTVDGKASFPSPIPGCDSGPRVSAIIGAPRYAMAQGGTTAANAERPESVVAEPSGECGEAAQIACDGSLCD